MPHIDYYFGVMSPWSYLAGLRLDKIATKHGATVTYKPLDLPRLFDLTGGTRRENRPEARLSYSVQALERWSARLEVPLTRDPWFRGANPAPASYAIIAAQAAGGGDLPGLVQALMAAVWVENRDLSDEEVIREKLSSCGFEPKLTDSGLLLGAEVYARNLQQAVEAGVFGSPFYVVTDSGARFWGQDNLDFLDAHLAQLS